MNMNRSFQKPDSPRHQGRHGILCTNSLTQCMYIRLYPNRHSAYVAMLVHG